MLFIEVIAVYPENHLKPLNTPRKQNAEILLFKVRGTFNYHYISCVNFRV
jgi:hypothetical protein